MVGFNIHRWSLYTWLTGCLAAAGLAVSSIARAAEVTALVAPAGSSAGGWLLALASAAVAAGLGAFYWKRNNAVVYRGAPALAPVSRAQFQSAVERINAAPTPELASIDWDGPVARPAARAPLVPETAPEAAPSADMPVQPPVPRAAQRVLLDGKCQRILDRYIGARFKGVAAHAEDLLDSPRIIKAARLLFEDGRGDRAVELLALAQEVNPAESSTALAQLELLFLERDAAGYVRAAKRFARSRPASDHWPEISELARGLGVADEAFADRGMRKSNFPRYGPWPGLPNWIQGPWDLTGEVTLAELHFRMKSKDDTAVAEAKLRIA